MNYNQVLEFLFSQLPAYHRIGKAAYKDNLDNSCLLDEHTGRPHEKFMSVHVAGTNGKGSVSHMLASILQEAGYRTGLFTSPHLKDFRERIRVDGKMIHEKEVISYVMEHKDIIETMKPSFFEMTASMAFSYFARAGIDVAVIEAGLGGRLDSTNIITPMVSVITNIGHDHMDILGDTLQKVAAEKAGIIKNGVPVVVGETQSDLMDVFIAKAAEKQSELIFADSNYTCLLEEINSGKDGREYTVRDITKGRIYQGITMLGGDYQSKNIVTVFQVLELLAGTFEITPEYIIRGIENVITRTGFAGRWQILGRNPLIICDTGHNKEGLEYVVSQLKRIPKSRLHMVIGFVNDKDLSSVLPLLPKDALYYFTKASVMRALNEDILQEKAGEYRLAGNSYPDVKNAVSAAIQATSPEDVIFIGGSTFIVADALM